MKKKYIFFTNCIIILFCLSFFVAYIPTLAAAPAQTPQEGVPVQTVQESAQIQAPQGLAITIEYVQEEENILGVVALDLASHYYAYAHGNAQDVGLPTQLEVYNAQGAVQAVYLPTGKERRDNFQADKLVLAYAGKIFLFVDLGKNPSQGTRFSGQLSLLLCSDKHCLPVTVPLVFTVPSALSSLTPQMLPLWEMAKAQGNANASLQAKTAQSVALPVIEEHTGQSDVQQGAEQEKEERKTLQDVFGGKSLSSLKADTASTQWVPITDTDPAWNFSPRAFAPDLEVSSLGKALLFGLLAGLILNLMPCVLPVLTLKIQSLLLAEEGEERIRAFRTHNIYFALGILAQFFLLALILGSAGYMWGELFQNVYFVAGMLVVIFVLALSLMGVFTLPMLDLKTSTNTSPKRQAFMTGMVATLLATPCSGPLLGGVLSWAFLQPLYLIVLIIMSVGVGMSLPYMVFSWQPQWVRFMPKPGGWMSYLEKVVAFFLLGTVIYMYTILPVYAQIPLLVSLLLLAFLGWLWGTLGGLSAPRWRRRLLSGLFVLGMVGAVAYGAAPPKLSIVAWQDFNSVTFAEDLGKKPLLVEFTADWCPNCKFVEKTVLTSENLQKWQKEYNLTLIKVDITRDNAAGEKLLHALGSQSIPLTAVFGLGEKSQNPVVIRDIYGKEDLSMALEQALGTK